MSIVYENELVRVEIERSEIPWLKVFSQTPYREFFDAPLEVREEIFRLLEVIEKEMLSFFNPTKINIASFGNYLPALHWHIMARFEEDSFFPEPMWGKKQREGSYKLLHFEEFIEELKKRF